jgi:hypothetical protein
MIVFVFFGIAMFFGVFLLGYGLYTDMMFYTQLSIVLHSPTTLVPLGFYLIISSAFILIGVPIFIMMRIKMAGCSKRFDHVPSGKGLFDFIYRDGDIKEIFGDRIPGLGLFRIFKLGLIFDVGREPRPGSVYGLPGKKLRFCLQDINHNQNAKFPGFYTYLTDIGFNNAEELNDVLNGYLPELTVKIWNRLVEQERPIRAVDVIVDRMKTMSSTDMQMMNKQWQHELKKTHWKIKINRRKEKNQVKKSKNPVSPFAIAQESLNKISSPKENNIHNLIDEKLGDKK